MRAPDHGGLRPFRFVVVGDSKRIALAGLFATGAMQRGQSDEEVERARARAFNGPGLVALVARVRDDVPDVPSHEQWLCVGAALMNFMNALHLMGFGAKALSGASVSDPVASTTFCGPENGLPTGSSRSSRPQRIRRLEPKHQPSSAAGGWIRAEGNRCSHRDNATPAAHGQANAIEFDITQQAGRHGQQLGFLAGNAARTT